MMPLDTVKTRLQFQGASVNVKQYAARRPSSRFVPSSSLPSLSYKNLMDAFRVIYIDEGIRGFYRGFSTKLLYKVGVRIALRCSLVCAYLLAFR